jgi:hypothetical protein
MSLTTYRILKNADETFAVEVIRVGALPQMAAGFATEAAVKGWIEQDKRLSNATNAFRTPAARKWRES